jgi:hypothetical protein
MRLPPQVAAVLRAATDRPMRPGSYRGSAPSAQTTESISCQPNETLCSCGNNKYACCPDNTCHIDTTTQMCICGAAHPGPTTVRA